MGKVIAVTDAANEVGQEICEQLALAGNVVFAAMSDPNGRDRLAAETLTTCSAGRGLSLHVLEMDLSSDASVDLAISSISARTGLLDVVVHNTSQIVYGPLESFSTKQLAELFDTNVLTTQRVNRAALPQLRKQGQGLLVWLSASCASGVSVPFLGCYASTRACISSMALSYANELACWGIETSIIVQSALGPNHYTHSGRPADRIVAEEYSERPSGDIGEIARSGLVEIAPADLDPEVIAKKIADIVSMEFGSRPLRVYFGPDDDGAAIIDGLADRIRADLLRRVGLIDALRPSTIA